MIKKIFIKTIAEEFNLAPEDVLLHISHLAEDNIIKASVPGVTLSGDFYVRGLDALTDLPISEAIVTCIATHGEWKGDHMEIREHYDQPQPRVFGFKKKNGTDDQTPHNDNISENNPKVMISQATFKEEILLTNKHLCIYEKDLQLVKQILLKYVEQKASTEPKEQTPAHDVVIEPKSMKFNDTGNDVSSPKQNSIKPEVTQKEAANKLGVSVRTINNWEKGRTALPDGYPGRMSRSSFLIFAEDFITKKALKKDAQAKNNAITDIDGNMDKYHEGADW